ncbi:MAG: prepilin-type N-terminal cleavage/methylation domain-containing protein [Gemmatimonadota bacterium]|nr:prepilin-type N-terminal cleavage/methylation domain-containing protein [Gemmatimonadota bacterium]
MQKRGGFTLIEIMIVVVIIAILAAIGIAKYSVVKQQAYLATVKHDLKNLAISEEAFASSNGGVYFSHTYTDPADSANTFGVSQGVAVVVTGNGQAGWSATATHTNAPGHNCSVFVGMAAVPPATADGAPACN